MPTLFTNNAIGELVNPLLAVGGSEVITLGASEGDLFPVAGGGDTFYATVISQAGAREIVLCTSRIGGSNDLTCTRAQDGTAAQAFSSGDKFQLRVVAITLNAFEDDIDTNIAAIAALDARVVLVETGVEDPGNKMFFYQAAAPTAGWVIDATVEDRLLAVKDQSVGGLSYDVAGGTEAGSWTPTTHTHTGPSHVHTMNGHIHSMPSHTHTMNTHVHTLSSHVHAGPSHRHTGPSHTHSGTTAYEGGIVGGGSYGTGSNKHTHTFTTGAGGTGNTGYAGTGNSGVANPNTTAATDPGDTNSKDPGDTNSTDPGDTNASGTAATGTGSAPSTDRPAAAVGIICTKS